MNTFQEIFSLIRTDSEEINKDFERKALEALKTYKDAAKYPRKKKKKIRKIATIDYWFYISLSKL